MSIYFELKSIALESASHPPCPVEFQNNSSWSQGNPLSDASISVSFQLSNPTLSPNRVIDPSSSDLNLWARLPVWDWCSLKIALVPNAELFFTRILLKSTITNQIVSPLSHTLLFINSNISDFCFVGYLTKSSCWTELDFIAALQCIYF